MKAPLYMALLMALSVAVYVPAVPADGVGASGQCYDDDHPTNPSGGEDEVRVDTNTGLDADLQLVPGQHGIVDALLKFALGTVEDGGSAGTACDRYDCYADTATCEAAGLSARYDYLEVDVTVLGQTTQVCYRGTGPSVAGDCPRHPTGAGQ
jgi:hypothetical protein